MIGAIVTVKGYGLLNKGLIANCKVVTIARYYTLLITPFGVTRFNDNGGIAERNDMNYYCRIIESDMKRINAFVDKEFGTPEEEGDDA
jgi:predicted amidohydrolase